MKYVVEMNQFSSAASLCVEFQNFKIYLTVSFAFAFARCLWDTKYGGEGEGFNNTAAMALKEEKSQHRPLFNNKSKLRKLVKTRDKEDECDNRSDNTKRATALNAVLQEQQQERPKNNTTPKQKRLVKTTTKEKYVRTHLIKYCNW